MEKDDRQQIEELAKKIAKEKYDLIGLQEVNQLRTSSPAKLDHYFQPTVDQKTVHEDNFLYCLTERLKELDCRYYWSWTYNHIGYDVYHEGIGLLSKNPIEAKSLLLSESADLSDYHTRRAIIGETRFGSQKITAVSGHFSWWQNLEQSFAYEWRTLEKALMEKQDKLIIMGDFNNDEKKSNEGYDLVRKSVLNIHDAFNTAEERTGEHTVETAIDGWGQNTNSLRIDYIFASGEFKIESYNIAFNGKNGRIISDHYGIEIIMD